eukprot:1033982-Rhodomonas_salina.2
MASDAWIVPFVATAPAVTCSKVTACLKDHYCFASHPNGQYVRRERTSQNFATVTVSAYESGSVVL